MRPEHISDALGLLSDEMLEQARTAGGKEKRMRRRKYYAALILVAFTVVVGVAVGRTYAASISDRIEQKLEVMGVTDAVYQGEVTHPLDTWVKYTLYTSKERNEEYYFDPQNGELVKITDLAEDNSDVQPEDEVEVQSVTLKTEEDFRQDALARAAEYLGDDLIGELRITETFTNNRYRFVIKEFYKGYVTGTRVSVTYTPEGGFFSCVPKVADLLTKLPDGSYELIGGYDFVSKEVAIQSAYEALLVEVPKYLEAVESVDLESAVCSEVDYKDKVLVYTVTIPFNDYKIFVGEIDAYTGEFVTFGYTYTRDR